MKFGHVIWLGSEDAFFQYQQLSEKYSDMLPDKAMFSGRDELPEIDETFGVRSDRAGLHLLEKSAGKTFLKVHGTLVQQHEWWHSLMKGRVTSYEALEDALDIVARSETRDPVIMDIASGGGMVKGLDNASRKIKWARQYVTIDAHTDSSAFSAAYWLASTARKFTASPMAEVGSIGTLLITQTVVRAAEKAGVDFKVFRAGEFKALGNQYEELTEKAAEYIQDNLEKTNDFFLKHVSLSRNLLMSNKREWAEGKTFFADEAKQVGLIDGVTTLDELVGGGAPQPITSNDRRYEMKISQEKLAQIAAGADPKVVLTAEELTFYMASLEADDADENDADEADENNADEGDADEGDTSASAAPVAGADVMALHKEIGRLEARLEQSEARAETLAQSLKDRETDTEALAEVAKVAVANLHKALGLPNEIPTTAAGITAKYTELHGRMAKKFKTGQQSAAASVEEDQDTVLGSFRHKS